MMRIYHSDKYVPELPPGHRFPITKYQLVREQLLYEGTFEIDQFEESNEIAEEAILRDS